MVPERKMLVATKNHKIKCPYPLVPEGFCVHNTYNDASAQNEVQYMINNPNQVSFHDAVDDKEVVHGISHSLNAWAAGDGLNGPGNRKFLHLEICYSKSGGERYNKAEENAVRYLAQELRKKGWSIDRVKKHQDFSGKHCPHRILDEGRWKSFLNRVDKALKGEDEMLEKAVVINSFADFPVAELLARRLNAPIYLRATAEGKKASKELYVVGGTKDKLVADKIILLSGADRYDTAAAVKKFLR
jgi:N-acetylmuramoyl-L-alanine amidase